MRILNILFLVTFVGILGCESREESRRKQVANNLKQIGLALEAYQGKSARPEAKKESATVSSATTAPESKGMERRADKSAKVRGEVAEFHKSPAGEVDGITLKNGTEVRFPPKSGEKVTAIVSKGDPVEISGWTHAGESEVHAATVTNAGSKKAVDVDQPPDCRNELGCVMPEPRMARGLLVRSRPAPILGVCHNTGSESPS